MGDDFIHSNNDNEISFREIVMWLLKEIAKIYCKEFRGGYWQTKLHTINGAAVQEKYYVPDTREEFCNAVNCLHDLVEPLFDKTMSEFSKQHEAEFDKLFSEEPEGDKLDAYKIKKVRYQRKMFRELNNFLNKKDYLKGKVYTESDLDE